MRLTQPPYNKPFALQPEWSPDCLAWVSSRSAATKGSDCAAACNRSTRARCRSSMWIRDRKTEVLHSPRRSAARLSLSICPSRSRPLAHATPASSACSRFRPRSNSFSSSMAIARSIRAGFRRQSLLSIRTRKRSSCAAAVASGFRTRRSSIAFAISNGTLPSAKRSPAAGTR